MKFGELAAEAIIEAKRRGDFTARTLKWYDERMKESLHHFMKEYDPGLLFDKLPHAVNEAAFTMFSVDGIPKAEKQKQAIRLMKQAAGGSLNLLKLGIKGWRATNG